MSISLDPVRRRHGAKNYQVTKFRHKHATEALHATIKIPSSAESYRRDRTGHIGDEKEDEDEDMPEGLKKSTKDDTHRQD